MYHPMSKEDIKQHPPEIVVIKLVLFPTPVSETKKLIFLDQTRLARMP